MKDLKEQLKTSIQSTCIDDDNKDKLIKALDSEDYRDVISRGLSGALFKLRNDKKVKPELHDKLSYVHDEEDFLQNCLKITNTTLKG